MKLCLVDVMVLNSTRSPGESQTTQSFQPTGTDRSV
jgi:hypothetical protein